MFGGRVGRDGATTLASILCVRSPSHKGGQARVSSPQSGSAIVMPSTSLSLSLMVQKGPARGRVRSTTVICCKAAVIFECPSGAIVYAQAACVTLHGSEQTVQP
jgi:hypothetical protein